MIIGIASVGSIGRIARRWSSSQRKRLCWGLLLGGLLSVIGALCYAELASAYPHAGGEYHFLGRAFGRRFAFLYGWARLTVIQTGSLALLAYVYGDYATQLLPLGPWSSSIHAAIAIVGVTAVKGRGPLCSRTRLAAAFRDTLFLLLSCGCWSSCGRPAKRTRSTA